MAISKEDSTVLTAVFGEEVANKISGAITEELSLGLRLNGKILTPEQLKAEKETAIVQGKELRDKEYAKHFEVELLPGEKDPVVISEKLKSKLTETLEEKYKNRTPTDEQIALAKKASEYEEKNKKLIETLGTKERETEEWKEKFTRKERETFEEKLNNRILSSYGKDMKFDRNDALTITRSRIDFVPDESGNIICKRDGKIVMNALGEPETPENVVLSFSEEKGWYKQGGMGGVDRGSGGGQKGGMTPDQARAYLRQKGIAPTSIEGLKLFSELTKK